MIPTSFRLELQPCEWELFASALVGVVCGHTLYDNMGKTWRNAIIDQRRTVRGGFFSTATIVFTKEIAISGAGVKK